MRMRSERDILAFNIEQPLAPHIQQQKMAEGDGAASAGLVACAKVQQRHHPKPCASLKCFMDGVPSTNVYLHARHVPC